MLVEIFVPFSSFVFSPNNWESFLFVCNFQFIVIFITHYYLHSFFTWWLKFNHHPHGIKFASCSLCWCFIINNLSNPHLIQNLFSPPCFQFLFSPYSAYKLMISAGLFPFMYSLFMIISTHSFVSRYLTSSNLFVSLFIFHLSNSLCIHMLIHIHDSCSYQNFLLTLLTLILGERREKRKWNKKRREKKNFEHDEERTKKSS